MTIRASVSKDSEWMKRGIPIDVRDSDYPALEATFVYLHAGGALALIVFSLHPRGKRVAELRLSQVRTDLPLGAWEREARRAAAEWLRGLADKPDRLAQRVVDRAFAKFGPMHEVRRLHPDLADAPKDDKQAQRRLRAALRHAEIAHEYRENVRAGFRDPAAQIAEKRGVSPGTVRAWIFRARKAGYLDKGTGRAPGQKKTTRQTTRRKR